MFQKIFFHYETSSDRVNRVHRVLDSNGAVHFAIIVPNILQAFYSFEQNVRVLHNLHISGLFCKTEDMTKPFLGFILSAHFLYPFFDFNMFKQIQTQSETCCAFSSLLRAMHT